MRKFDEFMLAFIQVYPRLDELLAFAAVMNCPQFIEYDIAKISRLFHTMLSPAEAEQLPGLEVLAWFCVMRKGDQDLLSHFISDPTRSGPYALNGEKYATMVLSCLKFMCG